MRDLTDVRVTIFGVHYAPETTGNAPYTTAMAEALASAGASVRMITGVPHYPQWKVVDRLYSKGLRWHETRNGVKVDRVRHWVPTRPNFLGRAALEVTFLAQVLMASFKDRSDVLIAVTPTLSGLAAAILTRRGRPVGALVQDLTGASAMESGTSNAQIGRTISKIEYFLLRRTDLAGVITPRFGDVLLANGVDHSRLIDLPNFTHVRSVAATREDARHRLGWDQTFTVVHTGNMGMKQGLETVVAAAKLAQINGLSLNFVLVGDGNQRRELERMALGCQNIRFVNPLASDAYPYALAAADVLLVNERIGVMEMSLPSKLTSYAIAGRPIVAAVEEGGITGEMLTDHGAAMLCPAGNASALLDAVRLVQNSEATANSLVLGAKALHASQYGAGPALTRYREFLKALIGANNPNTTADEVTQAKRQ